MIIIWYFQTQFFTCCLQNRKYYALKKKHTLKSVTVISTFSGTGHTTTPRYGFLIPGCQLWA